MFPRGQLLPIAIFVQFECSIVHFFLSGCWDSKQNPTENHAILDMNLSLPWTQKPLPFKLGFLNGLGTRSSVHIIAVGDCLLTFNVLFFSFGAIVASWIYFGMLRSDVSINFYRRNVIDRITSDGSVLFCYAGAIFVSGCVNLGHNDQRINITRTMLNWKFDHRQTIIKYVCDV